VKSRLIDAAAFAIGMVPAFLVGWHTDDFPWLLRLAMGVLSPGYFLGIPALWLMGAIGLSSIGFFFFVSIVVNGQIGWLTSYLVRNSLRGQRAARVALGLGIGVWMTWAIVYSVQAWPRPERIAPLAVASPLAGRWDGVLHGTRGDRHVTLVCHPRADSTLGGYLYVHGWDMGPFDEGTYAGDSLAISIVGYEYHAHVHGTSMDMRVDVGRMSNAAELQFVSADTSRPARANVDLGSPLAGRWDGVLHAPSMDRAIALVFQPRTDGTLEGYFYSNGAELGRLQDGDWAADSLQFRLERIPYKAYFNSTTMSMTWVIEGTPRTIELHRESADTTRLWKPQPNRYIALPAPGSS
jgi:hypothetical protein